nr:hypothetical protein [Tanacetum cinerariifolium]
MQTRSSSKFSRDQTSNPTSSTNTTPKGRTRRSSKQKAENSNFEEHLPPIATMADTRTMAEMLRAPTEGCAEAIVVPPILAEQFELKHSLINMMTSEQFFGLETDNLHDHIRWKDIKISFLHVLITVLLHQLDTFYNALNPAEQDSLNAAAVMLKQLQATPPSAPVKAVEEIYVTCGGAHPYYQCLAAGGNTFPEFRDNIQGYVSAAAANYNQGNSGYRPQGSGSLPRNIVANPKGELKAITTRSGLVTDGPTVPTPLKFVTLEVGERVEETYTDPDLIEYTIKVPLPPQKKDEVRIQKFWHMFKQLHLNITLAEALVLIPRDPGKFLIPCGFSELKCKVLADLGASINLMSLSVWKKLGLPDLIPTLMTLELANRAICTPAGIARDVFIPVGKFTFLADFVVVDYESDPRVPLILGRPFLRTTRALIDIHEGCNFLSETLPDIDSINDIHPHFDEDPLSGSTTYSSNSLLEEFTDELALITYPPNYDDNLQFDIESDLKEIEFLLYQVESDADNVYDDPFDSKGEKIKESKLLINELDLPYDFLPYFEYDSFNSQDFSRVDAFPSTDNEDEMKECHRMLTYQVDLVNPEGHRLLPDVSKPLPLGGPSSQVTIQLKYFFNKDMDYLVSGDEGRRSALSISKLKAAHYLDFGLEELVLSLWIESERVYDISVTYGISHWWFKRKEFYITRHDAPSDRSKIRSHIRILSVISLNTYERYEYTFLKEIVLRRADYKEYKISEADFKNLHPNDFEDLYLLRL